MTAIPLLLADLARSEVRVWAEGSRLRASGPPGALDEALRARLSARREEILAYLERRERFARWPVEPAAEPGPAPLSFAQERLWFLDQLEGPSPTHNMPAAQRLSGPLRRPALEQALAEVVRRHQVLRSALRGADGGEPVQVVMEPAGPLLAEVDLAGLDAERRERCVAALAAAEARRPFDLADGRLLRVVLLRLAADRHVVLSTVHHIASDGWSNALLGRELAALEPAFGAGLPSPLAELPVQYADFARWQRQRLSGEWLADQVAFWRDALDGAPRALELPSDRPRPPVQRFRGRSESISLGRELTAALRELARAQDATLHATLLAAFGVLLWRHTGEADLVVGVAAANRPRLELEGLIGCFADVLPLRLRLDGDPTFDELLARLRRSATQAYELSELPFGKLVEHLQPRRDLSRSPLVQVVFNLQSGEQGPLPLLRLPGTVAEPLPLAAATVRTDLEAHARLDGDQLAVSFVYDADLFGAAAIRRLLARYRVLLAAVAASPRQTIDRLSWLEPAERHRLLVDWNAVETAAAEKQHETLHETLHEHVLARADQAPDAVALVCGDEALSYGRLARAARRLARRLRNLGVEAETPVGLCVERSVDLVVGMLGILAAGGAYLPLDPEYPLERLATMLQDSGARVVVASRRGAELLAERAAAVGSPAVVTVTLVAGETEPVARGTAMAPRLSATATAANLAYLIYTSGSTGRPKGVAICHRNVVHLLAAVEARLANGLATDPRDVWTVCHSPSFDFSVWEIWGPLAGGGRLVIVPADVVRAPAALARLLGEQRVTVLHLTPSALAPLIEEVGVQTALPALRWIGSGGEALPPALATAATGAGFTVWNFYGPTEATVWSALAPVEPPAAGAAAVPIGRPLAGYRLHVVDRRAGPLPAGAIGELRIGGAGLARGYHRRPGLTAERFVPDPFAGERGAPGERLYRSGDLARYREDGAVECLGRNDQQVKLRGFRIELGEIEAVLLEQPAVAEAAVVLWQDGAEDRRLIAYVVATRELDAAERGPADVDPSQLRRALALRLPRYMLPATLVRLPELPRNRSGKLDRGALAARPPLAEPGADPGTAPRNRLEEAVAGCWSRVLGLPQVGVHASFFDLGGHSLLVLRLQRELTATLGCELTVVDLFRFPTVASLAEHLSALGSAPAPPPAGLTPTGLTPTVPSRVERRRRALAQRRRAGGRA